jgi:hypothetical protein
MPPKLHQSPISGFVDRACEQVNEQALLYCVHLQL